MPFSGFMVCLLGRGNAGVGAKTRLEAPKCALFLEMAGEGPALHL